MEGRWVMRVRGQCVDTFKRKRHTLCRTLGGVVWGNLGPWPFWIWAPATEPNGLSRPPFPCSDRQ
eukprot:4804069-Amphidinium_carterae.1